MSVVSSAHPLKTTTAEDQQMLYLFNEFNKHKKYFTMATSQKTYRACWNKWQRLGSIQKENSPKTGRDKPCGCSIQGWSRCSDRPRNNCEILQCGYDQVNDVVLSRALSTHRQITVSPHVYTLSSSSLALVTMYHAKKWHVNFKKTLLNLIWIYQFTHKL